MLVVIEGIELLANGRPTTILSVIPQFSPAFAPMNPYDDDVELTHYVWRNYPKLFTAVDWERGEGEPEDPWTAEDRAMLRDALIRQPMGPSGMFPDGMLIGHLRINDRLRQRASRQLLKKFPDEIRILRCAMCNRVVQTPRARQCLWCGFDWHASE